MMRSEREIVTSKVSILVSSLVSSDGVESTDNFVLETSITGRKAMFDFQIAR